MEKNNPFEDSIKGVKNAQKDMKKSASKSQAVKEGIVTPEEELKEPGYVIYNAISENVIKILQEDNVIKMFKEMSKYIPGPCTQLLIELLAILMTNASYSSILFYDELLKKELINQFDNVGHHINLAKSDIEGIKSAMEVHRKQLSEISETLMINKIKKDM